MSRKREATSRARADSRNRVANRNSSNSWDLRASVCTSMRSNYVTTPPLLRRVRDVTVLRWYLARKQSEGRRQQRPRTPAGVARTKNKLDCQPIAIQQFPKSCVASTHLVQRPVDRHSACIPAVFGERCVLGTNCATTSSKCGRGSLHSGRGIRRVVHSDCHGTPSGALSEARTCKPLTKSAKPATNPTVTGRHTGKRQTKRTRTYPTEPHRFKRGR